MSVVFIPESSKNAVLLQFYWCQFHQHFTIKFLADIFVPKNFKPKTQLCKFWRQKISPKCARKMLMKSTPALPTMKSIFKIFQPFFRL
jgi:hypothetical protein